VASARYARSRRGSATDRSSRFVPRCPRRAVAALAGLLALVFAAPALGVDLTVTSVEVTQATQLPGNTIALVAQRSTAVRATIGISGNGGASVAGVTGALHVSVNGSEITPMIGLAPINPAPWTAPASPSSANENDTLNFELTPLVASLLVSTTDADFRVDVTPVAGETSTSNNSGAANNLRVVAPTTPQLFYTSINYTPAGLGLPSSSFVQAGRGDAFVKGILPVRDSDANLYRQGLFPTLPYSENSHGDGRLGSTTDCYTSAGVFVGLADTTTTPPTCPSGSSLSPSEDGNHLLSLLGSCRQLIVSNGLGANETTFLFGWLAGNPINGNGLGEIGGRNAFGNTDPVRGQRSYAHELTHNLGFNHVNQTIDRVGWDVGARLQNNPGGNNTTGRVKPTTLFDIQVGGQLTNSAWIETSKYSSLLSNTGLGFSGSGDTGGDVGKRATRNVLVVQGILDPSGRRLIQLKPVFRYPWRSQPAQTPKRGLYEVVVQSAAGQTIRAPFDGGVHDDSRAAADERGFFEVMVPLTGQVTSVRIADRERKTSLAVTRRSKQPPRLRILAPRPGARLGARTRVVWRTTDADTPRSRLMFQAAYSPNGGLSYVPIAVDLRGGSFVFDSTRIQRSRGRGLIRVFASDGLNTTSAAVAKLTPTRARFPAP
jgi:hypothetical protein